MASTSFVLLTLLIASFFFPFYIDARNNGKMAVGTQLSTSAGNTSWLSPSGDFTFGFHQIDKNTFLPAIWYSNIPDTIVWWASLDDVSPSTASKGSKITLAADQGLVVIGPPGNNPWRTQFSAGSVGYCLLNDTGNLVVMNNDGQILWQSFKDVRDTLLPSQTMVPGGSAVEGRPTVFSKRSETNFMRGRFLLKLNSDGNLIVNTRSIHALSTVSYDDDTVYYSSQTNDASNPGYKVSYDNSGHMYVLQKNGTVKDLLEGVTLPAPENDYYFRAKLNFDGVFAWYSHPKKNNSSNSGWSVIHYIRDDSCYHC